MKLSQLFLSICLSTSAFIVSNAHANLSEEHWILHLDQDHQFTRQGDVRGTPYIGLAEIATKLNLRLSYDPTIFQVTLTHPSNRNKATFYTYSDEVTLELGKSKSNKDSHSVNLSRQSEFFAGQLCVPIEFGDRVLRPLMNSQNPPLPVFLANDRELSRIQVVIDPGHGGNDHGATQGQFKEKDLNLLVAKELKKELQTHGVGTLLTREQDLFVTLSERARMANQSPAKLFLSLHFNSHASEKSKLSGFEVYVLNLNNDDAHGRAAVAQEHQMIPADLPEGFEKTAADLRAASNLESSLLWADRTQKVLKKHMKPSSSQSVRMAPFYLLYASQMPALLLELGYLSSQEDMNRINDPVRRKALIEELAKKIAQGLKEPAQ